MGDIKISRVNNEKYSDIKWYLDSLIPYVNYLFDLCFVDYEGTRYMVTSHDNAFVIVAYENGELNPYRLIVDENGHVVQFYTEESCYDLSLDFGSGVHGVRKDSRLTGMTEQLVFFPADEELPVTSIDYYQVHQQSKNCCIMSHELPSSMTDLGYGLNYAGFHQPSKIALFELKKILGVIKHVETSIFFKTPDFEEYRKTLFRLHNILIPTPFYGYNPDKLISLITEAGYKRDIPEDLKGMIQRNDPTVKRLEYVASSYQDFIKGK